MSEILITVIHPTARVRPSGAFPEGWREAARKSFERCDNPDQVQYITIVHESRWDHLFEDDQKTLGNFGGWANHELLQNTGRDCVVDQGNAALGSVQGKLVLSMQDDMFPPQGWDTLILEAMAGRLDSEAVLHVSSGMLTAEGADGWAFPERNDSLYNPQIITAARARRLGYFGYPEYISAFSDDDFSEHARLDGCVIDAEYIIFEHRHPIFGGPVDEIYHNENKVEAYRVGLEVLIRRRAAGFPPYSASAVHETSQAVQVPESGRLPKLVVCLPGESFHARWVASWDGLRCFLSGLFDVQPIFGHGSNVYRVRNTLAKQALDAGADYVLWIDDDNTLHPREFLMLWEDLQAHASVGVGLVAAWCWIAWDGFRPQKPVVSFGRFDEDGHNVPISYEEMMSGDGDLLARDWTGFPCVLMPRSTLEKVGPAPFAAMFSEKYADGMSGEDTAFCRRVKDAGLAVVVDRRVRIPHLKVAEAEPVEMPSAPKVETTPSLLKRAGTKVLQMMGA